MLRDAGHAGRTRSTGCRAASASTTCSATRTTTLRHRHLQLPLECRRTMAMTDADATIHKGLAGVVVDATADLQGDARDQLADLSRLPGAGPRRALQLRGGRVPALERRAARPAAARRASSPASERTRELPTGRCETVGALPNDCHPMDVLRTAVSVLGAEDPREDDNAPAADYAKAIAMLAKLPTIVALDFRRAQRPDRDRRRDPTSRLRRELLPHVLRRGARAGGRRARSTSR